MSMAMVACLSSCSPASLELCHEEGWLCDFMGLLVECALIVSLGFRGIVSGHLHEGVMDGTRPSRNASCRPYGF